MALLPARLDRAGEVDGPAVEQELLGERGLAGVRVADDGEGAPRLDGGGDGRVGVHVVESNRVRAASR